MKYKNSEIQELTQLTDTLLSANYTSEPKQHIQDLSRCIAFHEYFYYIESNPKISDKEYDFLFDTLIHLEEQYPDFMLPNSPTHRVGGGVSKEFQQVKHLLPMLSLENSYNEADITDFDRKVQELSGESQIKYLVEPKFDGAGISLVYENNRLIRAVTRGDGLIGEDITPNGKVIRSIPLEADFSKYGIQTIEIRGEVMIAKDNFLQLNNKRLEQGLTPLANPRNSASGALRMLDSHEVASRKLDCFVYHISYAVDKEGNDVSGKQLVSLYDNLMMLKALGFMVPHKELALANSIEEIMAHIHLWQSQRDNYKYELDGMVIKVDNIRLEEKLGYTSHHPRWAIAYKFTARQATTKLLQVEFQVGRTGMITPVAKLQPVGLSGVTISSISMFNADFIKEKDIKIGDTVLIERAGDVIPYIVRPIIHDRNGSEQSVTFPTHCPSCNSELIKEEGEAAWRCVNYTCPAQVSERLIHFCSRDAMEITGLGDANINKFVQLGYLKSIPDIYRLPFEEIENLEGFGKKSVEKLKSSLEQSKSRPLHKLIFGLGIRFVGETTAKILAESITHLSELSNKTEEELQMLQDVGIKVAQSICLFFANPHNKIMIEEIEKIGVNVENRKENKSDVEGGIFSEEVFLFTGTLQSMGRNEAKKMVEERGGEVAGSLSAKVNTLVVGTDAGSKLDKAKKIGTIKIITEEEFLSRINNGI